MIMSTDSAMWNGEPIHPYSEWEDGIKMPSCENGDGGPSDLALLDEMIAENAQAVRQQDRKEYLGYIEDLEDGIKSDSLQRLQRLAGITQESILEATHQEAVDAANNMTITYSSKNDGWYTINPVDWSEPQKLADGTITTSATITTTASYDDDEDDDDYDYITVNEFKNFIYDMVKAKGGALPDLEDWKLIKNMMDMLYDEEDYEDEWYGSDENEILVGDADGPITLYYDGQIKFQTTEDGINIKNSAVGDIYHDTVDNITLVYDGLRWQPTQ